MNDKEIKKWLDKEIKRQEENIELIASENFVSRDVLEVTGSVLTNKYAEGYPGKRYYGGCEHIDEIENIAINRLKKLFDIKYVNVQPHSGTQANMEAVAALIKPGDKILGMSLDSGGHLSHGYKITSSGTFYKTFTYGVNEEGYIDYDEVERIAMEVKPNLIICGYSAYSREFSFKKFKDIAKKVGAYLLADIAHIAGIIAVGLHNSPVGHADVITSTTHKTLRGSRGGIIMTNDEAIAKKINRWVFPGFQGGPLMHQIAGKAVAFGEALQPEFKEYIKSVLSNAKVFAKTFQDLRVKVISGGTDNHLFTIDVKEAYGISGKEASTLLDRNNITANKNTVPNDELGPMVSSGIRVGTPAMTTKGFNEDSFRKLAKMMHELLSGEKETIKDEVKELLINK